MAEIIFKNEKVYTDRKVRPGDFFITDNHVYIVGWISNNEFRLISINDGCRWSETNIKEFKISEVLNEFINCMDGTEYIPKDDVQINFNIIKK